jgi:hypothetical protein
VNNIIAKNRRFYPKLGGGLGDYERTHLLVVLVAGEIGDYAAYAGDGPDEWVASRGDKLSFEEASIHFPQIKRKKYRD